MSTNHATALADIIAVSNNVQHIGTRYHLRSAFICLSNAIVRETFGPLPIRNAPVTLTYNGARQEATQRGVTLTTAEFRHIYEGRKLDALKEYKTRTGKLLTDAKRDIEDWGYAAGYYNSPGRPLCPQEGLIECR